MKQSSFFEGGRRLQMTLEIESRPKADEMTCGPDPHCSTCAYRVNESRRFGTEFGYTMVCLHQAVVRADCRNARSPGALCGHNAALWVRHATLGHNAEVSR